jgi:hypothetical protein
MNADKRIQETVQVLGALGMPREQQNDRTALCLLALLNLAPATPWSKAANPLVGITPMMDFARTRYGVKYAPNTRETFRRFSVHQLVQAGLVLQNPECPERPVNSPKTVYAIAPETLRLLKHLKSKNWGRLLAAHRKTQHTLAARYAGERTIKQIPVRIGGGILLRMTPGAHSNLIRAVVEQFAPRFIPGADLLYVGDTGKKWAFRDESRLHSLGICLDAHGKMPDVVVHDRKRNWLVLIEVVTSHGPVSPKRHEELKKLFWTSRAGLVFVTAFPSRTIMSKYWSDLAWETEVWVAEHPDHLIHLNGSRFLGPYEKPARKGRGP